MKRKIAALLAADIAEYSRLVAEDEEETLRRLASYRSVIDDFISKASGRIFNTAGDAVLAEFPSSVEAVRCAIDIQESLRTRNLAYPQSRQMNFRIGVTVGDVVERDGDLLGDAVNIAARLEGLSEPGGICISRSVYEQVANKLSVQFDDIGEQKVKNIPTPVHAYTLAIRSPSVAVLGIDQTKRSASTRQLSMVVGAFCIISVVGMAYFFWTGTTTTDRNSTRSPEIATKSGPQFEASPQMATAQVLPADKLVWAQISNTTDVDALKGFVARYPESSHKAEVDARITTLLALKRFNENKLRAFAANQSIPLPKTINLVLPNSVVLPHAAKYLGAWGASQGWGGRGRHAILVVTSIDDLTVAFGFYAFGPPTPTSPDRFPAAYRPFKSAVASDGLKFESASGRWKYSFEVRPDGIMFGQAVSEGGNASTVALDRID